MSNDMSIWGFLSHFKRGFAKPNRYRVEFNLPRGVRLAPGEIGVNDESTAGRIQQMERMFNANGSINIKCHTMNFPQRSMLTYEIKQNSAPWRLPYSASYDPVTFSFYADSGMDTRDYFDIWQAAVNNFGTNTMNFLDEYTSDIRLYALDATGVETYGVVLYEAWPLNVGVIDMSYSQVDNYQTTTVTMNYKTWKPLFNNTAPQRSA